MYVHVCTCIYLHICMYTLILYMYMYICTHMYVCILYIFIYWNIYIFDLFFCLYWFRPRVPTWRGTRHTIVIKPCPIRTPTAPQYHQLYKKYRYVTNDWVPFAGNGHWWRIQTTIMRCIFWEVSAATMSVQHQKHWDICVTHQRGSSADLPSSLGWCDDIVIWIWFCTHQVWVSLKQATSISLIVIISLY